MGWTTTSHYSKYNYDGSKKSLREICREEIGLNCDNENGTWKVIDDMATSNSYYAIVSRLNKKTNITHMFVAVCLITKNQRDGFGYKDMSECMHPYAYSVTQKFLDKVKALVPIEAYEHEGQRVNATEWRNGCQQYIEQNKAKKQNLLKFSKGTVFKYGKSELMIAGDKEQVRFSGNRKAHWAYPLTTGQWIKESQLKKATIL
jgi:hypothetical protein